MQVPKIKEFLADSEKSAKTEQKRKNGAPDAAAPGRRRHNVSNAQKMKVVRETTNDDINEQVTIFDAIDADQGDRSLTIVTGNLEFYG